MKVSSIKNTIMLLLLCCTVIGAGGLLTGCEGDTGPAGAAGAQGADGADGANGADGVGIFSPSNKNITFSSLSVSNAGGYASVDFTITDGSAPVTGVTTARLRFFLAELVPGATVRDSDQWQRWAYERTGTGYTIGTFQDLGAGRYIYTFATPLSNAPHAANQQRMVMRLSGMTGYNSVNKQYDFTVSNPAMELAGGKDIVTTAACNNCHGANINDHGHGGGYTETKTCVICHSPLYADYDMVAAGFDFVTMAHQIHSSSTATDTGNMDWSEVRYPGTVLNCAKCHTGTSGDNWKTKPTRVACDSCHTSILFTGASYTGIKGGVGELHNQTTDQLCWGCHIDTKMATDHTPPSTADATQRTMSATITGVTVSSVDGSVAVNFTVSDNGLPVTTQAGNFTTPLFSLVKLVPGAGGASSHWQSYTSRFRTKDPAVEPVLQGSNESNGTITELGGGAYSYKFRLITAEPEGDIRNVTHAHNVSTVSGMYSSTSGSSGWLSADPIPNIVTYDPTLTHRVAMAFTKIGTPNIDNATNAYYDFVPNGSAVTKTRNIVTMNNCSVCHAGSKLHSGYATEYCVTCHNQSTFDPYTGETVDLQRFVHKVHMGKNLPSVIAGGTFVINGVHDYSDLTFPQPISNCKVCHVEAATSDGANWKNNPTRRACGACHDSEAALTHLLLNTYDPTPADAYSGDESETCSLCHAPGRLAPVEAAHYGVQ